MADKQFRARIWDSTAGAVETTVPSSQITGDIQVGGQVVRPLDGRTESRPWQLEIVDDGDYFTSLIADSGGRMVLLGRKFDIQQSTDGGSSWATLQTGRISDIQDHVASYSVTIDDERYIERNTDIFTEVGSVLGSGSTDLYAGTKLIPPAVDGNFIWSNLLKPIYRGDLTQYTTDGNFVLLSHEVVWTGGIGGQPVNNDHANVTRKQYSLIEDDLKDTIELASSSTAGAFNTLRCRVNGVDREIMGFTLSQSANSFPATREEILEDLQSIVSGQEMGALNFWVLWSTSTDPALTECYAYMPTHEPTPDMPLHIGGGWPTTDGGIHPFALLRDVLDEIGEQYSSGDMQAFIDNPDFGLMNLRIKRKWNAARFIEDVICKPTRTVLGVNQDGEVVPLFIGMPRSTAVAGDVSTLQLFDASNTAEQPTWRYGADIVTRLRFSYSRYRQADYNREFSATVGGQYFEIDPEAGIDQIVHDTIEITHDHDRIDDIGVHEQEIDLQGWTFWSEHPWADIAIPSNARQRAEAVARETFSRYGDGSIQGTLIPFSTVTQPALGDYVRVGLDTFPAPHAQARGSTRAVQVVSIANDPAGPICEWIDAGPALNPLSVPTISLSTSTGDPNHKLTATIGGLSSGNLWQLSVARGDSVPASSDSRWSIIAEGTTSTLTHTLDRLASGSTWYARVRATEPDRISSNWSTAASAQTEELTAPSALATSSVTGNTARIHYTDNEPNYRVEAHLDQSATCPSSGLTLVQFIPAGNTQTFFEGLALDSTHCVGLRYGDLYGGYSTMSSISLQTTTDPEDALAPQSVYIIQGQVI